MTCDEARALAARESATEEDDRALGLHLASCLECSALAARDAALADPLVRARAAREGLSRAARTAGSAAVAASLLLAAVLALRSARPAPAPVGWTLRGDSTGVVLTGPGVSRRGETLVPPKPPKGDRT